MKGGCHMDSSGHKIALVGRERLEITGVEEVESFDEGTIIMSTNLGALIVRGEGLHIETLSLDGGALKVEGRVESLTYEEPREAGGGLLSRLFR
ncbi:MAG: sporulation protein YabP [Oscillospiraceae bacterium]